jgi:polyhydroxybutyrate depolymerase
LTINGTDDPLVPYHGGDVAGGSGRLNDTDRAVRMWVQADGADSSPRTGSLPDTDPTDGCTVQWSTWSGGRGGTEVALYRVEGGHTWPGGPQYLLQRIVGRVCRDFDATAAIWQFFQTHPRE